MTLLEWKPEFSVGIASMDFEHKKMIGMINEIYDELLTHRDADSIEQFLGDIHTAISAHFALEERMMKEAEYVEYEAHKDDHEELLDEIRDMMDQLQADPEKAFELLRQNLVDWFGKHFATYDARLHGLAGQKDRQDLE